MAHTATLTASPSATLANAASAVAAYFKALGSAIVDNSAGAARIRRVEALQMKSDAELAKLGIRREDIVRHVFRDALYL